MKICFLAHASHPRTRQLVAFFRDRGHSVSLVSITPAEPLDGVELYILQHRWPVKYEKTNWQYLWSLPRLWRLLRRIRPDLISAEFVASNGVLGAVVRPRGCPLVVAALGSDINVIAEKTLVHKRAIRFALARADLILSVAPDLSRKIESLARPQGPILTLQSGIDLGLFHPPRPDSKKLTDIVSARGLTPIANVDLILEAVRILDADGHQPTVQVLHEGPEQNRLETQFRDLVEKKILRFEGKVTRKDLADRLRSASIYVSMTSSDGASITLLEAMACGAFPVVSDIAANRDWIENGVNGFLVPLGDPRLLAERLKTALSNPALRHSASARNRAIARERADERVNMAKIEAAFVELVQMRQPSPRLDNMR